MVREKNSNNRGEASSPRELGNVRLKESAVYSAETNRNDSYNKIQDYIKRRQNNEYMTADELKGYRQAYTTFQNENRRLNDYIRVRGGTVDVSADKDIYDWLNNIGADLDNTEQVMAGFKNADEYSTAVKDSNYRTKYQGKTYAELEKELQNLSGRSGLAFDYYQKTNNLDKWLQEMEAFSNAQAMTDEEKEQRHEEAEWLSNYMDTDRAVIESMTLDELKNYRVKHGLLMKDNPTLYYDDNNLPVRLDERIGMLEANEDVESLFDTAEARGIDINNGHYFDYYENNRREPETVKEPERVFDQQAKNEALAGLNSDEITVRNPDQASWGWSEEKTTYNNTNEPLLMDEQGGNLELSDPRSIEKGIEPMVESYKYETEIRDKVESLGYNWDDIKGYLEYTRDRELYDDLIADSERFSGNIAYKPLSLLWTTLGGVFQLVDLIGNLEASKYGLDNPYNDIFTISQSAMLNRDAEDVGNLFSWGPFKGKLASTAYKGIISHIQSTVTNLASVAIFGPAAGEAIGLSLLGSQAAQGSFHQTLLNGNSYGQAFISSVVAGLSEAVFEKLQIDELLKAGKALDVESVSKLIWSAIKQTGKQSLVEAIEESGTNIVNEVADRIINDDGSEYERTIESLVYGGMSLEEAKAEANKQYWEGLLADALGGAFGGLAGGVNIATNAAANYKTAKFNSAANKFAGTSYAGDKSKIDGLITTAKVLTADGGNKSIAETLKAVEKKAKTADIGKLSREVSVALNEEFASAETITELDSLKSKYGDSNVVQITYNQNYKRITGHSVTEMAKPEADTYTKTDDGITYKGVTKEGVEVEVKGIDVVTGEIVTDKGNFAAEDIALTDNAAATLVEKATEYDNHNVADLYIAAYDPNRQSVSIYNKAFKGIYTAATLGKSFDEVWNTYKDYDAFDETEAKYIWQAGYDKYTADQSRRDAKLGKDTTVAETPTKKAKSKGEVRFRNGVKADTAEQKNAVRLAEQIAKIIGIDIEFFDSRVDKNVNGWFDRKTDTIHLDMQKAINDRHTIAYTLSHELVHYIEKWSPAKYDAFAKFLLEKYAEKGMDLNAMLIRKQLELEANNGGKRVSVDTAYSELIADSCEAFLLDSNATKVIAELATQDKSLAEKIKRFFADILAKLRKAYKGLDPQSEEGKMMRKMAAECEQIHRMFEEALADATKNYQSAEVAEGVSKKENATEMGETLGVRNLADFAEAKNTDGDTLFQYKAMEADENTYKDMLKKWGKMSDTQINNLFTTIDRAMEIIKDNLEVLDYAWEADINDRAFYPVKPNSDSLYKVSLDFSTLCRKRILQQTIIAELQAALDKPLTREEGIAIRDALMALQEEGRKIEVACALCYVESARMKSPEQIKKFLNNREKVLREFFASKSGGDIKSKIKQAELDMRAKLGVKSDAPLKSLDKKTADAIRQAKKDAKASYIPTKSELKSIEAATNMTVSDFTSPEGLENLAKNYPDLFDAYTSYVRNATKSKGIENDTWWRAGDSSRIGDVLIANMNKENGLRTQSWSDFQVVHILDYIAATIELSTRNAKEQAYTKVPDYVELMGKTGVMINMSLIPTSEFTGKLEYDEVEGIAYRRALELREKYPDTAGTICIGIDNKQIQMLLADINIDYVIPYHRSGMATAIRKLMHIPTWSEYEKYQGETKLSDADAKKNAEKYGVKLLDKSDPNFQKHTSFSEWFDLEVAKQIAKMENANPTDKAKQRAYGVMYGGYMAMQNAADNYLKLCAERGLAPKFSHEKADFTAEDNYWKLLIDRKMVNNVTGDIIEQQTIQPIFDEREVLRILNDELERYPSVKADQDYAVRKVTENFLSGNIKSGMSAKAIAEVMRKPVDNVTKVNIEAAADDVQYQAKRNKPKKVYAAEIEEGVFRYNGVIYDTNRIRTDLLDNYTEKEYNKYAWAVVNGIIAPTDWVEFQKELAVKQVGSHDKKFNVIRIPFTLTTFYFRGGFTNPVIDAVYKGVEGYEESLTAEDYVEIERIINKYGRKKDYASAVESCENWCGKRLVFGYGKTDCPSYGQLKEFRENGGRAYFGSLSDNDGRGSSGSNQDGEVGSDNQYQQKSSQLDRDYMDAVNRGDTETAQKMVDEAAKAAFPNSILIQDGTFRKMWHHSKSSFNSFLPGTSKSSGGLKGIYFTPQEHSTMSRLGSVHKQYYLNVENMKFAFGVISDKAYVEKLRVLQEGVTDRNEIAEINRKFKEETGVDAFFDWQNGWYNILTPEQIKSADPITYDDNGNVIPLSERFKESNPDIRYQQKLPSDRKILADALESVSTTNEKDADIIRRYKAQMDTITKAETRLAEVNAEIKELSFAKGKRDTNRLALLHNEKTALTKKVNDFDKRLLRMESTEVLKNVLDREKAKVRAAANAKTKEKLNEVRQKERDKAAEREANLKAKANEKLSTAKEKAAEREADLKSKASDKLSAAKERAEQREAAIREKFREAQEKGRENRAKSELRSKIKKFKEKLENTMLNPTDRTYVPAGLFGAMVDVCELIDTDTDLYKADGSINKAQEKRNLTHERLLALEDEYNKLKSPDGEEIGLGDDYDAVIADYLKKIRTEYSGKSLSDMTVGELDDFYTTLVSIQEVISDSRKLIGMTDAADIYEAADSIADEQRAIRDSRKNGKRNAAQKGKDWIASKSLAPMRAVERMSDYNRDSYLVKLFKKLEAGVRDKNFFKMTAYKDFEAVTTGKNAKNYESSLYDEYGTAMTDKKGNTFHITKMQGMQVLLSYEREVANKKTRHIEADGFSFADLGMIKKGKMSEAISDEYIHEINGKQAMELVERLKESLKNDAWANEYMNAAREFFNDTAKNVINSTMLKLKHRLIAKEKAYIPFEVDKAYLVKEISGEFDIQQTISGYGMLQETQTNAAKPLVITGLNNVLDRHIDQVGSVYGLAIPIRDFNKVWNVRSNETPVNRIIGDTWGKQGKDLITQAIKDLQSKRNNNTEAWMDWIKSNYIEATFYGNFSVISKQIGSMYSARAMIGWRSAPQMLGNLAWTMANYKKLSAEVDQYTASVWMRRQGVSDAELETLLTEKKKGFVGKALSKIPVVNKIPKLIAAMDSAVALSLWKYCKADVRKSTGLSGEELNVATAEYFDEVVEYTQSMADVLHRPEIQKQGGIIGESLGMFKTDLYQQAGQLQTAFGRYMNTKSAADAKALGKAAYACLSSALWASLMTSLFAILRYKVEPYRDDEDELTAESWLKYQGLALAGDLAGYVLPLAGGEIVGIVRRFTTGQSDDIFSSMALDSINGAIDAVFTIGDIIGKGEMPSADEVDDLLGDVLQMFGVPYNNVSRIVKAIKNHAEDIANGEFLSFNAGKDGGMSKTVKKYTKYIDDGDNKKADTYLSDIIADKAKEKVEKDGYEGDSKYYLKKYEDAAKSDIRSDFTSELKPLYLKALEDKDNAATKRIRKIMAATQLYDDIDETFIEWRRSEVSGDFKDRYLDAYERKDHKEMNKVLKEMAATGLWKKPLNTVKTWIRNYNEGA